MRQGPVAPLLLLLVALPSGSAASTQPPERLEPGVGTRLVEVTAFYRVLEPIPESIRSRFSNPGGRIVTIDFLVPTTPTQKQTVDDDGEPPPWQFGALRFLIVALTVILLLVLLAAWFAAESGSLLSRRLVVALATVVVIGGAIWANRHVAWRYYDDLASLYLDNAADRACDVYVDGRHIVTLGARSHVRKGIVLGRPLGKRVRTGLHIVVKSQDGTIIDDYLIAIQTYRHVYLFNIGGLNTYTTSSRSYR